MPSFVEPLLRRLADHFDVELSKFSNPIADMIAHNWYLGLTCFGGPGVHFQIVGTAQGESVECES